MEKKFSSNPMKDPRGYLTGEEIDKLMAASDNPKNVLLILLLSRTGRRVSELLSLKVGDINFREKMILWNILKRKNNKQKWKPIDEATLNRIKRYIEFNNLGENDFVFFRPGNKDCHITRQRAFQIVRYVGKKAGITFVGSKKLHPHHFRHSVGIYLTKKFGVAFAQRQLEHSNLLITQNYLQFSAKDERAVADSLNQISES